MKRHCLLLIAAAATLSASAVSVFVSPTGDDSADGRMRPVATLLRALETVRKAPPGETKEIVLADGRYEIAKQLYVERALSNLTVRAEHPGKAVLTGARAVAKWSRDAQDPRILVAKFPFAAEPETLYVFAVNGRLADFSAYPEDGAERRLRYAGTDADASQENYTRLEYDPLDLPKGFSFRDLDTTSAFLYIPQEYASSRCYVATNDWRRNTFHLKSRLPFAVGRFNQGYQVMNTRLGLSRPGTWMFEASAGRLLYRPRDGEDAASLEASVSAATGLVYLDGTSDVTFSGLVFEGCAVPFREDCHPKPIPGLLTGHDPVRVTVSDCLFRNTAGAAVHFVRPRNCVTRRSVAHDLGSYGFHHFWGGTGSVFEDCEVYANGLYSPAAPAIEAQGLDRCRFAKNHVHDTPGCGFVMWCEASVFCSNRIARTMRRVRDGGGLYGAQNDSLLFDNDVRECGDWPGLYNDEGGRDSVYFGNRFTDCWWPFHMHDTYGIVITNNVFTDNSYMRFSLQGATHTVFKDNVINSAIEIHESPYLENCDVWDNVVNVRRKDGTYRRQGRVVLPRAPAVAKAAVEVPRLAAPPFGNGKFSGFGGGRVSLDRDAKGLAVPGVPGAWVALGFDATNLYVHGRYEYNKFISYRGSVNLGHTWGRHDGLRLLLGDLTVEVFFDGTVRATDGSVAFDASNSYAKKGRSVGDGFATFAFAVSLARFGLKSVPGETLPFNAISYNHDHREYKYAFASEGALRFVDPTPDCLAQVPRAECLKGVAWPQGSVRAIPETSDRRACLMGFSVALEARTCGLRMLPFTGPDPASGGLPRQRIEAASEVARPHLYSSCVENWALALKATASENAAYFRIVDDHLPFVRLLVDCPTRACVYDDGRGVLEAEAGLFAKVSFDPKPVAVRELSAPTAEGRRLVFDFVVTPVVRGVSAKVALGPTASEAARRFAADGDAIEFAAREAACRAAWTRELELTGRFREYIRAFRAEDVEHVTNAVSNAAAEDFLVAHAPRFACPDRDVERAWAYRWWSLRKHFFKSLGGWCVSEFTDTRAIACPVGHHLFEGRWFGKREIYDDYTRYWFKPGANPIHGPGSYVNWIVQGVLAREEVTGDRALADSLLDRFVVNYEAWEKGWEARAWPTTTMYKMGLKSDGLFHDVDDREGTELTLSGNGARVHVNAMMYGEAKAIARIAARCGRKEVAAAFEARAERLAKLVKERLWNDERNFFCLRRDDGTLSDVCELHGYSPWYAGMPLDGKYAAAWTWFADAERGFAAPLGLTFPAQSAKGFVIAYEGHACQWNGPSWPFATSVALTALNRALRSGAKLPIGREAWLEAFLKYARQHRQKTVDGAVRPWLDEVQDPYTGDWIAYRRWRRDSCRNYNHSTFCDLVVTGLVGLKIAEDGTCSAEPNIPADWDWFRLENLPVRGRRVTITYDRDGARSGSGLHILTQR